ncbi:hypothetical protein J5N97_028520 [Dioscorea zingiberensis]|uniref:Uncharacterized protein n=1 Tax=Dioscorea zingiberensis TaxID=325984 RepID=A0A9D5BZK6_9LILI|nr:hypothetical protein J5N97_028520 [Dioscorea zingiberensis]
MSILIKEPCGSSEQKHLFIWGVYYFYELAKRAEILQQYLLQASAYFQGYGGLLGAVQRANDPLHIVLLVWQSVLWAIHCEAWHLTRMRNRGQPLNIDYWIPDRPILEPILEPQATLLRLREHLNECWQWYELLEHTVLARAQGVVFIKKRMEAVRMAYLAAAYASTPNVPTSFAYDQPVPRPGSLTFVFPEPPPSGDFSIVRFLYGAYETDWY